VCVWVGMCVGVCVCGVVWVCVTFQSVLHNEHSVLLLGGLIRECCLEK
jgi:hypothetical protein